MKSQIDPVVTAGVVPVYHMPLTIKRDTVGADDQSIPHAVGQVGREGGVRHDGVAAGNTTGGRRRGRECGCGCD